MVDLATGRTLFKRRIHARLPNASTTKMVTALVTVARTRPGERVRVSAEAASIGGGGLDLDRGEVYRVRDLLYALLLDSSNEAAAALADHIGPGIGAFVEDMNQLVREIGADDTQFRNPHGLDEEGHYSSADDLVLIAQQVLIDPMLGEIVATVRETISVPGGSLIVENRNVLLESYRGAIGVKTGRTLGAGDVLVAAAQRGANGLIAVAMRSTDAAADARALLDYGFAFLRDEQAGLQEEPGGAGDGILLGTGERIGALVFDPAGSTPVVADEEIAGVVPLEGVDIEFSPVDNLELPLEAGEEVGTVELRSGGSLIASASAVADMPLPRSETSWIGRVLSGLLRSAAALEAAVSS